MDLTDPNLISRIRDLYILLDFPVQYVFASRGFDTIKYLYLYSGRMDQNGHMTLGSDWEDITICGFGSIGLIDGNKTNVMTNCLSLC